MTILTVLAERRLRRAEISCPLLKRPVHWERTSQQRRVIFEREEPVHDTPALVLASTLVDRLAVQYSFQNVTWAAGH